MRLTKYEKVVEEIVLLLLTLKKDKYGNKILPDELLAIAAGEAGDMAVRAYRARTDPSWWERAGAPHWNKRMARIKLATMKSRSTKEKPK